VTKLTTLEASSVGGVRRCSDSLVFPLELSANSAGKWGAASEEWTAETVVQSAGMAERDAGTVVA
jgi:hypothetical protein